MTEYINCGRLAIKVLLMSDVGQLAPVMRVRESRACNPAVQIPLLSFISLNPCARSMMQTRIEMQYLFQQSLVSIQGIGLEGQSTYDTIPKDHRPHGTAESHCFGLSSNLKLS